MGVWPNGAKAAGVLGFVTARFLDDVLMFVDVVHAVAANGFALAAISKLHVGMRSFGSFAHGAAMKGFILLSELGGALRHAPPGAFRPQQ